MSTNLNFLSRLRQDIIDTFNQKYGSDVSITIDIIQAEGDETAHIEVTISKDNLFVTRYYGKAYYEGTKLHLKTHAI